MSLRQNNINDQFIYNIKSGMDERYKNIRNGSISGLVEVLSLYPLDLLKTSRHIQKTNLSDIILDIYKKNGVKGFYRGILPPLLTEAPKRGAKFGFNELYKNHLNRYNDLSKREVILIAGCLTGISESALITPSEVIKIRLQNDKENKIRNLLKKIYLEEGIQGFSKGLLATCLRGLLWNATYFSVIEEFKAFKPTKNDKVNTFLGGSLAGLLSTTVNNPIDVVKSRIQSENKDYVKILPTLKRIVKDEGAIALYRGYGLKALRYTIGGGIMITIFDFLK